MEQPSFEILIFLITAGFVASFIDSVVGGGGLISVPALLAAGLPPGIALGTNKLGGTMSSLTSSLSFLLSGKMDLRLVKKWFPLSLLGSAAGAYTVRLVPPNFLKPLVIVLLIAVTVYTLFKKKGPVLSGNPKLTVKTIAAGGLVALAIGYYDGFFGPGTGSFLLFAFVLLGFDFVTAAGGRQLTFPDYAAKGIRICPHRSDSRHLRKLDSHFRPRFAAGQLVMPSHLLQHNLAEVQAQTDRIFLGREERDLHQLEQIIGNAGSGIADREHKRFVGEVNRQPNASAVFRRLRGVERIFHELVQHFLQIMRVDKQFPVHGGEFAYERDTAPQRFFLHRGDILFQKGGYEHRAQIEMERLAQMQPAFHIVADFLHLIVGQRNVVLHTARSKMIGPMAGGQIRLQRRLYQLQAAPDDRERIQDAVRRARRHVSDQLAPFIS
ncbi:TSUP family transporter [Paenibacillus sp. IB182363]|uniref:Probable membrane transporter protein n=1 Tax=Paenibacillus oceani TaxID=2772510 RepID=A0A927C8M3_9BACL|nr:TSUP family transporter [Paenibacillus oceani]